MASQKAMRICGSQEVAQAGAGEVGQEAEAYAMVEWTTLGGLSSSCVFWGEK